MPREQKPRHHSHNDPLWTNKISNLYAFIETCRYSSIRDAAKAMFITPQGLSQQIQNLEQKVGTPLIHRSNKGFALTPSGKRFYQYAFSVVMSTEELRAELMAMQSTETNQISLVYSDVLTGTALQSHMLDFERTHPQYVLSTAAQEDDRVLELLDGKEPVLALTARPMGGSYASVGLDKARFQLLVPTGHPAARVAAIDEKELAGIPLILCAQLRAANNFLLFRCRQLGIPLNVPLEAGSFVGAIKLCKQEKGAALVMDFVASELDLSGLVCVPLAGGLQEVDVALLHQKGRHLSGAERAFLEYMRGYRVAMTLEEAGTHGL